MTEDPQISAWQSRVAAAPGNLLFRFSLAQVLLRAGQVAESVPHLDHCIAGRSDWLLATLLRADAHRALGQTDEARRDYARALELAIAQNHEDPGHTARRALEELDGL